MAKFKPARAKGSGKAAPTARGAIPCILILVLGMALLLLLFYAILKPG
jgi:hypothetical protein